MKNGRKDVPQGVMYAFNIVGNAFLHFKAGEMSATGSKKCYPIWYLKYSTRVTSMWPMESRYLIWGGVLKGLGAQGQGKWLWH